MRTNKIFIGFIVQRAEITVKIIDKILSILPKNIDRQAE